ncbi:hypothetical protein [Kaistia defluvii]|uniref:DUF4279 domain-containing protein n=1 Tax=Kaistia defluvii TaxID=410841 RepID=A0ABV2R4C6_9HYPH
MIFFRDLTRWDPTVRIDGVLYPASIAWLWSDAEMAAIGLYRAKAPSVLPDGKQPGPAVEWAGEGVRYVLEDIPPAPIPSEVSAAQAKLALDQAEILDDVEAMIAAHPVRAVQIWFADANNWQRGHPYVSALGLEMALDEQAIDTLFVAAERF